MSSKAVRALLVALAMLVLAAISTGPSRRTFDALVRFVFPPRVTIQVAPGNIQVAPGSALVIGARVVGANPPRVVQLEIGEGTGWRTTDMASGTDGRFRLRMENVTSPFKYRVLAGQVTSPTYSIEVLPRTD